ncbi:hypothetical protein ABZ250_00255 [Streptomyces afghaniensis]|uniref:hypothetical protein n=1 Tax=Streptomyces afghaniensis TaxID=66865 RepID=UPI00339DDF7E
MSDMTRSPGDETPDVRRSSAGPEARGSSVGPEARGSSVGPDVRGSSVGPDVRGSSVGPDARGETALGTGHGTTPHQGHAGPPGTHADRGAAQDTHLLPHDESDKLVSQLHHAVAEFVDAPRAAVEEADHVLEEIAARFTEAVTQRRRTLRHSWQSVEGGEGKPVSSGDTEQLRLALKDYRELAERLLHV